MTSALPPLLYPSADPAPALDGPPAGAGATNPKQKRSGYVRDPHDFYVEPAWCAELLFDEITFHDAVYDPCCGIFTIPKVAISYGLRASGRDIVARSPHQLDCTDFLECQEVVRFQPPNIVCNPPYKLAEAFARKAIRVAYQKVAILVRLDFLASQKRHALFVEHPPAFVLVLSRRPSMPPGELLLRGEVRATSGQHDFMWVVWECGVNDAITNTIVRWLK